MQHRHAFKLYYIHDPMCSWCWGFHPVLRQLEQQLPEQVTVHYVLGGLAADSDLPMPDEMQHFLQQTWRNIQKKIPGTDFNFDFWSDCKPKRSTYPACRAVIAARNQNRSVEKPMINAIQNAYYLQAKNPSDDDTLMALARQLKLDAEKFAEDLNAATTQQTLVQEIELSSQLGAQGFPSLVFEHGNKRALLTLDYNQAGNILQQINRLMLA
ncbi:MAG: DsbA family protein [Gammaproteobacteria bacterium]|nr:DsbA family protein [Gammaproteobacteria bacterium]